MTDIDRAAHTVMQFNPFGLCGAMKIGEYTVFYHEGRLYSLRRADTDMVILVRACNPHEAVAKARGVFEDD